MEDLYTCRLPCAVLLNCCISLLHPPPRAGRSVEDLYTCRALLDSLGMNQTKIIAKVGGEPAGRQTAAAMHERPF